MFVQPPKCRTPVSEWVHVYLLYAGSDKGAGGGSLPT